MAQEFVKIYKNPRFLQESIKVMFDVSPDFEVTVYHAKDFDGPHVPQPCLLMTGNDACQCSDVHEEQPKESYVAFVESLFNVSIDRANVLSDELARSQSCFVVKHKSGETIKGILNSDCETLSIFERNFFNTLDVEYLELIKRSFKSHEGLTLLNGLFVNKSGWNFSEYIELTNSEDINLRPLRDLWKSDVHPDDVIKNRGTK